MKNAAFQQAHGGLADEYRKAINAENFEFVRKLIYQSRAVSTKDGPAILIGDTVCNLTGPGIKAHHIDYLCDFIACFKGRLMGLLDTYEAGDDENS